jgi:hypothetical protein
MPRPKKQPDEKPVKQSNKVSEPVLPAEPKGVVVNLQETPQPVRDEKFRDKFFKLEAINKFCKKFFIDWSTSCSAIEKFFEDADETHLEKIRQQVTAAMDEMVPILPFDPYRKEWSCTRQNGLWFHEKSGFLITEEGQVIGKLYDENIIHPAEKFTSEQKEWCENHNLTFYSLYTAENENHNKTQSN